MKSRYIETEVLLFNLPSFSTTVLPMESVMEPQARNIGSSGTSCNAGHVF